MAESSEKVGRKGDGVLLVVQDNAARRLFIASSNDNAANMLGYARGDLDNHELNDVLARRTSDMLGEELEYTADAPDFSEVMARQREIRLKNRIGEELTLPFSVMRVVAGESTSRFQLVLPDEREKIAKQKLRDFLTVNLDGHKQLDEATGLPDKATTEQFLGLISNYLSESKTQAVFAVLRLDRFEKSIARYGKADCVKLMQHVANCCRSTFRTEDVISALSDRTLGLVLFDISRESARMVFNRLRWNVRNHVISFGGKDNFSITISIAFDMLDGDRKVLELCEKAANAIGIEERNSLVEAGQ